MALIPPDLFRCQAEIGGFMMLGPGRNRCVNKPSVIVVEADPGQDGQRGSMSLCDSCLQALHERMPDKKVEIWRNTSSTGVERILSANEVEGDCVPYSLEEGEAWMARALKAEEEIKQLRESSRALIAERDKLRKTGDDVHQCLMDWFTEFEGLVSNIHRKASKAWIEVRKKEKTRK